MNDEALVWPIPMPTSDLIRQAYWDLYPDEPDTDVDEYERDPELPRPWDITTCTDPDLRRDIWEWYDQVVTWFNHEYVWDPSAGMIPPCWPLHPHLIHDIGVLADQRRTIALATNSNSLEEWHRIAIPAFLTRLRDRIKHHCDEQHQPWPARVRFGRHQNAAGSEARKAAYRSDVEPRLRVDRTPHAQLAAVPNEPDREA